MGPMQKKNEADQLRKHRHLLSKNDISEGGPSALFASLYGSESICVIVFSGCLWGLCLAFTYILRNKV